MNTYNTELIEYLYKYMCRKAMDIDDYPPLNKVPTHTHKILKPYKMQLFPFEYLNGYTLFRKLLIMKKIYVDDSFYLLNTFIKLINGMEDVTAFMFYLFESHQEYHEDFNNQNELVHIFNIKLINCLIEDDGILERIKGSLEYYPFYNMFHDVESIDVKKYYNKIKYNVANFDFFKTSQGQVDLFHEIYYPKNRKNFLDSPDNFCFL